MWELPVGKQKLIGENAWKLLTHFWQLAKTAAPKKPTLKRIKEVYHQLCVAIMLKSFMYSTNVQTSSEDQFPGTSMKSMTNKIQKILIRHFFSLIICEVIHKKTSRIGKTKKAILFIIISHFLTTSAHIL